MATQKKAEGRKKSGGAAVKKSGTGATPRQQKKSVIAAHATHQKDTGSAPVQVAILTERITHLTAHLKIHPKDDHSRRGLLNAVGKRRKLLKYLKDRAKSAYKIVVEKLGIRG